MRGHNSKEHHMSDEQQLEEIEVSLEATKEHVELAECLARLKRDPDFKRIFLDKYTESYAARLVRLKGSVNMQDEVNQKNIDNQIHGIGQFNQYMLFIEQEGHMAKKMIEDMEEERDAIQAERAKGIH
jgi:hypothetical protein